MGSQSPLAVTPSTTSAINRHPLKVSPEMSVVDVIHQMSHGSDSIRTSCAVVVDDSDAVIGIVTERDIVGLTATQHQTVQSFADMTVSAIMTTPVKTLPLEAFQDIFGVLFLFRRYHIRHLPIVDELGQLIGVVTPASIRKVLKPANLLKLRRVSDIMTTDVVQAPANVPVIFLAQLMAQHRVSCVVIVDTTVIEDDGEPAINPPIGIVTERDIVQYQSLALNLHQLSAREAMSAPLFLLDPKDSLWEAHQAMQNRKVRRLVVSWNWGRDIGIITQTSLLRVFDPIEMCSIIDSLQKTVQQLGTETESNRRQLPPSDTKSLLAVSTQDILTQSINCIAVVLERAQMSTLQTPKLQQAKQLLQQVTDSMPTEIERLEE